jgi:thioredoxin reductase (NADPH)
MKIYDSVVIGGGPAGMTAALYLLRSGAEIALVEKLSPGGQVLMTESVENYPGFPKGIKGYELADTFAAHLDGFSFDRFTDSVLSIEALPNKNLVKLSEQELLARTVVICSGAAYRHLELPRERELTGRGVSYCALCDGNFFRDQVVAVVGGGNSALEESLYLAKLVRKLYIVHRRDAFRGAKVYQDKVLGHPKIEPVLNSTVSEILGKEQLTGIVVEDCSSGARRTIELDGLFIFIGFRPLAEFLPAELEVDKDGFVITDTEMRTNLPGVFAAGDVRSKLCRQVSTAVGDGATAANTAFLYLEQNT